MVLIKINKYLEEIAEELYIVAKRFTDNGCTCYRVQNKLELRSVLDVLELLRPEKTQIVILGNKVIFMEYAPYREIETLKEFVNRLINMCEKKTTDKR